MPLFRPAWPQDAEERPQGPADFCFAVRFAPGWRAPWATRAAQPGVAVPLGSRRCEKATEETKPSGLNCESVRCVAAEFAAKKWVSRDASAGI